MSAAGLSMRAYGLISREVDPDVFVHTSDHPWSATRGRLLAPRRPVSGGADGAVRVWEAGTWRLLHTLTGHTGGVAAVGRSPDGTRLATGGFDGALRVWEAGLRVAKR